MGFIDFLTGGNSKVAAKSTVDIFNYGLKLYGSEEKAYLYTYIFRCKTIAKSIKCSRDEIVLGLICGGHILNLTQLTIANLATGAAPKSVPYEQTDADFNEVVSKHLIKFGLPEEYVSGIIFIEKHVLNYLKANPIVPAEMYDALMKNE